MTKRTTNPIPMRPTRTKKSAALVAFTQASAKDQHKVTVSLTELAPYFKSANYTDISELMQGTLIVVGVLSQRKVLFEVNRAGKTAATNAWPLIKPQVSRPVHYVVNSVVVVNAE